MPNEPDTRTYNYLLLYIEDNAANLALVEQLLDRRKDVKLLSASTGAEGLALAFEQQPDAMLLDINLPDISGLEVLRQVRAHPLTADMPVIALSSDAFARQIEQGIAAGFYRYLTKPFEFALFLDAVDAALFKGAQLRLQAQQ